MGRLQVPCVRGNSALLVAYAVAFCFKGASGLSHSSLGASSRQAHKVVDSSRKADSGHENARKLKSTSATKLDRAQHRATESDAASLASASKAWAAERAALTAKLQAAESKAALNAAEVAAVRKSSAAERAEAQRALAAEKALAEAAVTKANAKAATEQAAALKKSEMAAELKLRAEEGKERSLSAKVAEAEAAERKAVQAKAALEKSVAQEATAARHDRVGLLSEISELQEDLQASRKQEDAARSKLSQLQHEADERLRNEVSSAKMRDHQLEQKMQGLQAQLQATRTNLTAATSQSDTLQNQATQLSALLSDAKQRLLATLSENNDLQAAKDSAAKAEATASQKASEEQRVLRQEESSLGQARHEIQDLESKLQTTATQKVQADKLQSRLQAQLVALQKSSARMQEKTDKQLHETMLDAAAKVRDLEDRADSLTSQLQGKQQELAEMSSELAQQKDVLAKESSEAREANQKVAALLATSSKASEAAKTMTAKEAHLSSQISQLQEERSQLMSKLGQLQQQTQDASSEVDAAKTNAETSQKAAAAAKAENKDLREKLAALQDAAQSLRSVEGELEVEQAAAKANSSKVVALEAELQRLRQLEEHYSSDDDNLRKELETWHSRVAELETKLKSAHAEQEAATKQKESAVDQIKAMGSQEDEYFQENSQLRQQNEDLSSKLEASQLATNRSEAEVADLKTKLSHLQVEEAQQQDHYSHAMVAAQAATASIKKSFLATQAELRKTQQALQDAIDKQLMQNKTIAAKAAPKAEIPATAARLLHKDKAITTKKPHSAGHGEKKVVKEEGHEQRKQGLKLTARAAKMPQGSHKVLANASTGLVQVKAAARPGEGEIAQASRNPLKELMALFTPH